MKGIRYTAEFKAEAIKQITERGQSATDVAQRLGTSVKQHAILSRLVVETASNSFYLSMSPSSVLAGGFWSDLYGHDLRNTQALFSTKKNDYSHRQRHGAFPSHRTQTHSYC